MLGLARDEFPHADRQLLVSVAFPYTCTTVYFFLFLSREEKEKEAEAAKEPGEYGRGIQKKGGGGGKEGP